MRALLPPHRVHCRLLDHTIHRRSEQLKLGSLLGLYDVLRECAGLLLGFRQIVEQSATVFRLHLCAGLSAASIVEEIKRRIGGLTVYYRVAFHADPAHDLAMVYAARGTAIAYRDI